MAFIFRYLRLGCKDLFDKKVFLVAVFPFALTALLFLAETLTGYFWLLPLLEERFAWMREGFFAAVADVVVGVGFMGLLAIINVFLAILLIGIFFTDALIKKVNQSHYRYTLQPFGTMQEVLRFAVVALLKFFLLFLAFIPLYFIPLVNALAFALPSYFYFKSTLLFDVGSQCCSRQQYARIIGENRLFLYIMTVPLYLLLYIPFVNIFAYIFAFLVVTHFFLDHLGTE